MAPEILCGEKYGEKVDIWSVGAVLYEMAVGIPPFRAQNHVELTKKINQSKGIKFPDEDPRALARAQANGDTIAVVPDDIKKLIRSLLKRIPAERYSFEQFFASAAMENSKFPRPIRDAPPPPTAEDDENINGSQGQGGIPEHHRVIPPEVLDPKAIIPPSKFNFRRRESAAMERCVMLCWVMLCVNMSLTRSYHVSAESASPRLTASPASNTNPLPKPVTAEVIPGETEEDGILRREYVLVDEGPAVEFHKKVDGKSLHPHCLTCDVLIRLLFQKYTPLVDVRL